MGYVAATRPTFYFIGVTTAKSSIMKVFPKWAAYLGLGDVEIKGIDMAVHDTAERYRGVVAFLKTDPLALGALVTTHKLDLFAAAHDMFDVIDPLAQLMAETSCISKRDGKLICHADDRAQCIERTARALREFAVGPIKTTIPLQLRLMENSDFRNGGVDIHFLERLLK